MNESETKVIQMELDMAIEVVEDFFNEVIDFAWDNATDEEFDRVLFVEKAFRRILQSL